MSAGGLLCDLWGISRRERMPLFHLSLRVSRKTDRVRPERWAAQGSALSGRGFPQAWPGPRVRHLCRNMTASWMHKQAAPGAFNWRFLL